MSGAPHTVEAERILKLAPVVAVVTIADETHAVPMARALLAGGIHAIEITLRTPAALPAIRAIARDVPNATVGAGTVRHGGEFDAAVKAGARFVVSPGHTESLIAAAAAHEMPWLPGAATASEVMRLLEAGHTVQKFFPAESAGGVAALKSLAGPISEVRFCPTGGITETSAKDYLALPNVLAIGGSWLTAFGRNEEPDWAEVERRARVAAAIPRR